MIITVMSRKGAYEFSKTNPAEKTVIISITGFEEEENEFVEQPNIIDILRLKFDDVGPNDPHSFQPEYAEEIVEFVDRYKDEAERILVHCGAGVSRSAGVGAAIAYVLNGDNDEFFHSNFYVPNQYVFFQTLTAFFEQEEDEDENKN